MNYQTIPQDLLFYLLYGGVTMMSLMACCYLLLRRGNAFAPGITTPQRLRRWTAAFFGFVALGHLWYLPPLYVTSYEALRLTLLIGASFDFIFIFPLAFIVIICMRQDRRRSLWPVVLLMMPVVMALVWCIISRSDAMVPVIYGYVLAMGLAFIISMVLSLRKYGRWLRDNYADLEHKEVWQSFVVLTSIIFLLGFYVFGVGGPAYEYIVQFCDIVLIAFLLWRVETLSDLSVARALSQETADTADTEDIGEQLSTEIRDNIGKLLQQHCIEQQLYLQHDLTLQQLAKAIGTNRLYLGQYFSCQGTNYNTYINDLRIRHFVSLYRDAVAEQRTVSAQQLAHESGYRSYSTFGLAFKKRMGQSVSAWMSEAQ
jgi:AraC-like DNA-binding protein